MRESLPKGSSLEIESTVNLKGTFTKQKPNRSKATPSAITASGTSRYRERVLERSADQKVNAVARRYFVASLDKNAENQQRIVLRSTAARIVVHRENNQNTVFGLEGALTAPELDLLRAEPFTPTLSGLLPAKPVKTGERWTAATEAVSELTGVDPIQTGGLNCTLADLKSSENVDVARITFAGSVTGPSELGPCRQTIDGHFFFDLDQELITHLVLNGRTEILDSKGQVDGQLEGRYEVRRHPAIDDPGLSDTALKGLNLKPNSENTALLFEGKNLGIRFLYSRNWELAAANKGIVQLEEPTGGMMRLTFDPSPEPTAEKLQSELISWLKTQKATVQESNRIESVTLSASRKAERFVVRATLSQQPREWEYILVRQGDRTATVAANFTGERAEALRGDTVSLARSLVFFPKAP